MNVLKNNQQVIVSLTLLFVIILSCMSTTTGMSILLEESPQDELAGVDTLRGVTVEVPKLMKRKTSQLLNFNDDVSSAIFNGSSSIPKLAIGQQSGIGGGSVTIRDTFNWTGTIEMSTQNELSGGVPTTQTDSISITNSTSFNRQEGWFNISDVTATADWRLIENLDNTGRSPKDSDPNGDEFYEVAMSFNITEDWVNLTKVRIILGQNLFGNPEGELYIVNSTSGGDPDDTDILSESLTLLTTAVNWDTYTFANPILLPNGTYFLVMNATVYDIDNFWSWYWQNDLSDDGSEDGIAYYKDFDHGTWTKWDPATIPLQIEVLPMYYNGSAYINKTYLSPQELNFSYNTTEDDTELASFVWFDWNNTNSHTFQTETSVSFNLSFVSNYTYTPTINRFISYKTQNDSISYWNISFSVKAINQTYNIRNRHISILNIPDDWNGTKIYWNNSLEYPDIINDVNITWDGDSAHPYTHGNTSMVVNASTLQLNTTWNILLEAPNYFLAFNLSRGGKYLDFPYEANVTDTLGVNIQVSESGGNASYWIEDFNQQAIHNRTDFSSADFTDMWIIDDNVSQTININGSYDLQGFWISSDKTKVGTITRTLDVFINTTLTINSTDTIDVLIGDKITIWANYTSNHNSTINSPSHIDKAKIWCNASWPDGVKQNVSMNQPIGTYYNASFTTTNEDPGTSGTITIITQLPWFVNQSKTITINFVGKTNFAANQTNIDLKWRENTTLRVYFNDTSDNPVTSASIIIDGDTTHPAAYDPGSGGYDYRLNSTQYNGVGDYLNLNISAYHAFYQNQTLIFNLTINPADSSIDDASVNPVNYPLEVSNGSIFEFWVVWLSEYGDPLNDSDGVGISSSDVILDSSDAATGNHTFKFVPTTIGPINVTLTFQIDNYNTATFNINVTSIENTGLTVNETDIVLTWLENTTLEIWYNDSTSVPIPSATIIVDGDTSHPAIFNSSSGAYYYKLNSTNYSGVGTYLNLNITANRTYYQNQTIYFNLTINAADTYIENASENPIDYPLDVTNGSTFYFWVIWFSEYADPLNDSDGVDISNSDVILESSNSITGNHTFKFFPTTIGPINVTLTFQVDNYNAAIFHINVTSIESTGLTVNETNIILTWRGNITLEIWYNDSASVPIPSATIIVDGDVGHPAIFNSSSGVFYYKLNSTNYSGVGAYSNLNITGLRTYYQNQTIFFDLTINAADSYIEDVSVNPVDYPIDVINGSTFDFWGIWFSEYDDSLNDSDGVEISNSDVVLLSSDPATGNHTFKFVPTTIGPINVTLTFQINNYNAAIFSLNVTSIESTSSSVNETNLVLIWRENVTLQIWYNDSTNVPVSDATIIVDGDISHPAVFNSSSDAYYYEFNSTNYNGVGNYLNLNITVHKTYYQDQTLYFNLTINAADTSIDNASINPVNYPLDVTNGSVFNFWVIWLSEYGDPLNDSDGVGITNLDVVLESSDPITGNHTFKFVPTTIGPINVTLTFQIPNYLTAIFHINVTSIESTNFMVNITDVVLTWRENTTLEIWYNDSANVPIPDASIIIDGDNSHPAVYNSSSGAFYYQLNSTHYGGVGTYLNLNITAFRTYYQNQTFYFDLTINPADTSINNASVNPVNYPLEVTNGSVFYFWVIWLSEYGDPLNDTDGVGISNSDVLLNSSNPVTGNHTFEFVPTTIGPINVTLTFQINNYNAAIFNINVTSIESTSLTLTEPSIVLNWLENTTLQIWYNNSFNSPIEGATIIVNGDTSYPAVYNSSSGAYNYNLNSTQYIGVGTYLNLNITAFKTYYQNQTLSFDLTINPADTSIDDASVNPVNYPLDVVNGSTFYFWVIWLNEYGNPLNDSNGVGISSSDAVLDSSNSVTGNHTFKVVPTAIGHINITLTFQITNFKPAIFHLNITSTENTTLTATEINIVLIWRENTTLQIWYNDSSNNPINGATITVDGDTSHPAAFNAGTGSYSYLLNSTNYSGVGNYFNLNVSAIKTYYQSQTLYFNLTINPADSSINDASVEPLNYPLDVTNGSSFYFWIIWFSQYNDPLNDSDGVEISNSDIVLDFSDPVTGNHTFKFVPTTIGPINVSLTFQIDNYNTAIFNVNVTSIESTGLTVNETSIVLNWRGNVTLEIWYNNSLGIPIQDATIIVDEDTDQPASFNSSSGAYYYRVNSTNYSGVGTYFDLNITAFKTYYQNQTIYFNLTINAADTYIENASENPIDYPLDVTNGSTFYFWIIWFDEFGNPLNDSDGVGISNSDVVLESSNLITGNHTFKFVPTTIGPINVTLTFQIDNYNVAIFNINVTSIESTSFSVNETDIVLTWRGNTTLEIWYNDSASAPIPGATIVVDGDVGHPAVYNSSSATYYYQLNSTRYNGVGTYLNLNLTAFKTYYQNQTLIFDLTINPAASSINDASVNPVDYPIDTTNGSTFYFWVIWFSQYGDPLNDSDGVGISNSNVILEFSNPVTGNHTFKFVPTTIGPINVTLTFQINNYNAATLNINVTSIESTSLTGKETSIIIKWLENTTLQIWYNNSASVPIPSATIIVDGDTSRPATYNSSSGAYYYLLNSTHYGGVGPYFNLNITAHRMYYLNQTLYFNLTINPADTSINDASVNPINYPLDVTNGSFLYFWVIWLDEYGNPLNDSDGVGIASSDVVLDSTDPVTGNHTFKFVPTTIGPISVTLTYQITNYNAAIFNINVTSIESTSYAINEADIVLIWRENATMQIWYNDSANVPVSSATIIIDGDTSHPAVYNSSSGTYHYQLNSTHYSGVGTYLNLNITAYRTYYQNQTFFFNLTINPADSSIDDASVNPVDYPLDVTNGSTVYFWVIWFSQYGDSLNDSDGVDISSSDVVLDSTDPITGNHTFKFVPTTIGTINVTLTFQIANYNAAIFNINFTSYESTSLTITEPNLVLIWRENTTSQIWYNDSASIPIPGVTIIIDGDIDHPAVFNSSSGAYYYQLNSTQYNGVGDYLNLNVTAYRTYYQNQTLFFNLTINPADSTIENASTKLYPELNNIPSDEVFEFWIIWQSEYNDFLNASDGVLINGTLNNHPDLYLSDTDASIGNHSFILFYNGTAVLTFNLTFVIENYIKLEFLVSFNVFNRTMLIDNGLSNPVNGQTIDFLQYGEFYYFSVFINDSSTKLPLNTTILNLPNNVDFLEYAEEGNHTFRYNASQIGIFTDLDIFFSLQNYNTLNYNISFIVSPRDIILDSIRSTPQSIDYLQYGDIFYFLVYLNDSRSGVPLNISTFSELPLNFYFENFSITKGHLFWYQAIERGDFTFEINFSKLNFNTYTHSLIFNVTKGNSELIPSTTSITTYYSNDAEFSLVWQSIPNPNISSSPILRIINTSNIIIQPSSPEWLNNIIINRLDNGNYSFTVISNRVGTVVITIYQYSDHYNLVSIDVQITITLMPTFEPQISYQSELIVGESLIISWDQWLSTNTENVPIDELQLLNDGLSVDYTPVDITELSFDITIDTEDFRQGFHNLTLIASSYGYENHNLSVFIEIIGREIQISIELFPENLIQGLDFTIKAILTYASLQTDSVGFGSTMSLVPLEGVSVSFLVKIMYENGTTLPLNYDTTTNALGEAEFTVNGIYTLSAEGIESITVTSEATASGKESTQSTPANFSDIHKFEKEISKIPEELIILGITILLFAIIVVSPIGFYTVRKRRKGRKIVRDSITKVSLEINSTETPEVSPEVTSPIVERKEDKTQLQMEDKTETDNDESSAKKTEETIFDIEEQQAKPSSWITQFPQTFSGCEKEIRFLFILVLKRKGQWYGKTSYNFLLKKKIEDLSASNLRKIYMILPQQTSYFKKEKTSIIITEEGKRIALKILKRID